MTDAGGGLLVLLVLIALEALWLDYNKWKNK